MVGLAAVAVTTGCAINTRHNADKRPSAQPIPSVSPADTVSPSSTADPDNAPPDNDPSPVTDDSANEEISACRAGDLSIAWSGGHLILDNWMGTEFRLTNFSGHPCRLSGYAQLQFVDHDTELPTTVVHTGDQGTPFTVLPGEAGYLAMTTTHPLPDAEPACQGPEQLVILRVTLPDDSDRLDVRANLGSCARPLRVEEKALSKDPQFDGNAGP